LSQLEQEIDAAAHTVAIGSPLAEAIRASRGPNQPNPAPTEPLVPGMRAHVSRLGMDVEILESPRKGSVRVRAGGLTLSVALVDITRAAKGRSSDAKTKNKTAERRRQHNESIPMTSLRTAPMRMSLNTLDLRGERVDAALDRVDAFIDELLQRGEPAGYILHGHGTGALKQAVREHVRSLRQITESAPAAPEDGGDAFTLVWLGD
jgi:DNA mismatch repair protein MutS2